MSGATESYVNGIYHPDGEHLGHSRWKHESEDIWLRIGGIMGQVWRFMDSPEESLVDGRSKSYYYEKKPWELEEMTRKPWEVEWFGAEHNDFPDLQVKMLSQVAYSHLDKE